MADTALQCGSDYLDAISGRKRRAMVFIEVERQRNGGLYLLLILECFYSFSSVKCTTLHDNEMDVYNMQS